MKNEAIQNKFDFLWASKITDMKFNILNNSIEILLELTDNGVKSNHVVEFRNVSSFYFVNNIEHERKDFILPEIDDYLELTSISLIDGDTSINTKSNDKWIEQYNSKANVVIEIWSRMLFIEFEVIIINSEEYRLTS